MACKNSCKLCNHLIISTAVNYDAGTNTVIIGLPAGTYNDCEKYCIVIAQAIPTTAQISSNVVISIGTGLQQYPLLDCNCQQVTACGIRTRTKYSTVVDTDATGAYSVCSEKLAASRTHHLRELTARLLHRVDKGI